MLGGEDVNFDTLYYSPYQLESDGEEDAPVTKPHLKEMNEKLDKILDSSSTHDPSSKSAMKSLMATWVKDHEASISKATSAIDASVKVCTGATEKVDKLISQEKELFEVFRKNLSSDQVKNQAFVFDHLDKLQEDLALESKVMDELALKTTQLKTQTLKLKQVNKDIDILQSERAVIKNYVGDVHSIILHLFEAHDLVLTITVRRLLAEKLRVTLDILSRIKGVSESVAPP